ALLLVGLGFKVAAVPFHMWTPDVYQGAPTPVTGFMAAAAKAAGFAALLRIFVSTFGPERLDWQPIVWSLAVLRLVVGSVVAGVPLTSGFLAKFYVIGAAVDSHSYALAVIAMLAAVAAAFVYLRVIVVMYMTAGDEPAPARAQVPLAAGAALGVSVAFTLFVGL